MPTLSERIGKLEDWRASIDGRLWGDAIVGYERSIEGRVAAVEKVVLAADHLAEAARELRRADTRKWSHREKLWLFVFAALASVGGITGGIAAVIALAG